MDNAPCKECNQRFPGCHDRCERYKEFKREFAMVQKAHKEYKSTSYALRSLHSHRGHSMLVDSAWKQYRAHS